MRRKLQAAAGIVGPVWFATLVVLQGLLNPDYDHVRLPISALAAWPSGWIQNLNFFVSGALIIAFAVGLHHGIQPGQRGGTGIAFMLAGAAGIILAGVFPWIMVNGVPTETPSHVVGAVLTFLGAGLGLLVLSRRLRADPRWQDLATYTMATGIVVLLLFVVVGFFAIDPGAPFNPWAGLLQRVLVAVWFSCLIVLARRLWATSGA